MNKKEIKEMTIEDALIKIGYSYQTISEKFRDKESPKFQVQVSHWASPCYGEIVNR
ncbi:hypothetical protein ACKXGF_11795 [Alkalibacillus sp. S2W]|uniref:hypothetical protein n=1 Tax=Alkalibacillus sp. S2W TaxID=3386553 RepID=UPI00398D58AD